MSFKKSGPVIMKKTYKNAAFIFRRDLRLEDNTGLLAAGKMADEVIPCFIFDPRQATNQNEFKSDNALQFMIGSLQDLERQIHEKNGRLYLFYGVAHEVIKTLILEKNIDAIFLNRDYTPFALSRDHEIEKICIKLNCAFHIYDDYVLNTPDAVMTQGGTPYSVFTAYFKKAREVPVKLPEKLHTLSWYRKPIASSYDHTIYKKILKNDNENIWTQGGTREAEALLKMLPSLSKYPQTRDIPRLSTSNLSAHNKFGTVSIRRVYQAIRESLGAQSLLIQQLYWRDFFTMVAFHSPFVFGQPYHEKYAKLYWKNDQTLFKAWCEGTTGFPIVDAGMRQLNATGFMHNRVRMIVGSFLTKDLHIDWLWGEKYFAQKLVDYDPCVNNGNWQWVASTGCDAQPYFRIFNPWLQQKKFDPECDYIRLWVPELKDTPTAVIHNWYKPNSPAVKGYPRPLIDHSKESTLAKLFYKRM